MLFGYKRGKTFTPLGSNLFESLFGSCPSIFCWFDPNFGFRQTKVSTLRWKRRRDEKRKGGKRRWEREEGRKEWLECHPHLPTTSRCQSPEGLSTQRTERRTLSLRIKTSLCSKGRGVPPPSRKGKRSYLDVTNRDLVGFINVRKRLLTKSVLAH